MPYWIDDPALRDSIRATNATLLKADVGHKDKKRIETWTNPSQQWARPELLKETLRVPRRETCFGRDTDVRNGMQKPLVRQKIEPKLIFATERTFVHWLHASVTFLVLGAGAFAVADGAAGDGAQRARAKVVAIVLSVGSVAINAFALANYKWRLRRIRPREPVENTVYYVMPAVAEELLADSFPAINLGVRDVGLASRPVTAARIIIMALAMVRFAPSYLRGGSSFR